MTLDSLFLVGKVLLLKIHIMTGWKLPSEEAMGILVDQFIKKMQESYPDVNQEEVEYAFRNSSGVKDWGKAMNLQLIDEVMIPYLEQRIEVSRLEESQKATKELPPSETSDAEFIEAVWNLYWINRDWQQIPPLAYKILEPKLMLTRAEKMNIIHTVSSIAVDAESMDSAAIVYKERAMQYAVAQAFELAHLVKTFL